MIQIYCLADPRNKRPFYVGATIVPLKNRLSAHIHEAMNFRTNQHAIKYTAHKKHFLIVELNKVGMKPIIDLLYICDIYSVDYYEPFFYQILVNHGFELFNMAYNFNYSKYKKVPWYKLNRNN